MPNPTVEQDEKTGPGDEHESRLNTTEDKEDNCNKHDEHG